MDFYFYLKIENLDLGKIIEFGQKKFGGEFNAALFLQQLVYFKDLEVMTMNYLQKAPTEEQIKEFLSEEVRRYLSR